MSGKPPATRAASERQEEEWEPEAIVATATLKRSMWSLVKEHWQLVLLLAFNLVMMDMNMIFTYFLLVQTNVNCTYHSEDGAYVQSQTVALLAVMAWRPFSGLLTDALPNHNHVLLLLSAATELGGLVAMLLLVAFMAGELSPWPVLALSIFKQCMEVQLLNSIYKIFKMRLKRKCGLGTCDSQCHVISAVSIVGELTELIFNVATCVLAYVLITEGASFDVVKYVYFGSTLLATLFCVGLSISISCQARSYYVHSTPVLKHITSAAANPGSRSPLQSPLLEGGGSEHNDHDDHDDDHDHAEGGGGGGEKEGKPPFNLCRSLRGVFCVPVALGSIVVMTVLYNAQEFLYDAESLDIPGRHVSNDTATADNFCAGYLTNTVYQDVWENLFYIAGTLFYILVLKRLKPLTFFRWMLPIAMAVLIAVAAVISLPNVAQLALALSLEFVVAFEYFFFLYAKYLSIAAVSSEFYGMYSFVIGMMQSVTDLIIYGLMELSISTAILRWIMFGFMAVTAIVGVGFSYVRKRELQNASKHCE